MKSFAALAALVAAATATTMKVAAPTYGNGWVRVGLPALEETVTFTVAAKQQNLDALAEFVAEVSDPSNAKYGKYMTNDEVNAFTAPTTDDMDAIRAWLSPYCNAVVNEAQGTFECTVSVQAAETMFNTEFRRVLHIASGAEVVRCSDYEVPEVVADSIQAIFGLHGLPLPKTKNAPRHPQAPGMPPAVTPDVLSKAYDIKGVTPTGGLKNRMAVAEFQGQFMNTSDLAEFFKLYLPDAPASDGEVYKFHGETVNGDGIEAQLDIQFIMGVAPGIKTEFYEQANMDFCADLQNWTTLLLSSDDIPLVHSVSYGWQGNLTQIGCKTEEVSAVDANYMKLAAKGISIIFASGDSGSGYAPPQPPAPPQCSHTNPGAKSTGYTGKALANLTVGVPPGNTLEGVWICCQIAGEVGRNGYAGWTFIPHECPKSSRECQASCVVFESITGVTHKTGQYAAKAIPAPPPPHNKPKIMLWPSWPASSPYVTSVGATRFNNDVVGGEEAAVGEEDHFGSGGGFSPWTFLEPQEYTKAAIAKYFETVDPSTLPPANASVNKEGRATPDVSALGTGYAVINNGKPLPGGVGGTSASAPVFAGLVALLNEARIQAGKPAMGLVNPFIYANEDVFTDIVLGSDKIGRGGGNLPYGFNCSKGWDPVTGMGTPIFTKMLQAAMDL